MAQLDANGILSSAQALPVGTSQSQNVIDLRARNRRLGAGASQQIEIWGLGALVDGGGSPSVQFEIRTSANSDMSGDSLLFETKTYTLAELVAAETLTIDLAAIFRDPERYIAIDYVVTGTINGNINATLGPRKRTAYATGNSASLAVPGV